MLIRGAEHITQVVKGEVLDAKLVFNASGAIAFSGKRQHRDEKADGISYEDDYKGNALAAMVRCHEIEVRYHRDFRDAQVASMVGHLLQHPALEQLSPARVTYQGRVVLEQPGWQANPASP